MVRNRTTWRRAINTRTLPSCAGKILWLQALKYPVESELTSFIQSRSSLDTELLQGRGLPWSGTSGCARNVTRECGAGPGFSTATWEEPLTFSSVSTQNLDPLSRFPQTLLRCPWSTVRAWFWQPPAWSCLLAVLRLAPKAVSRKQPVFWGGGS